MSDRATVGLELVALAVSMAFAVFGIAFSGYESLWIALHVPVANRQALTIALSIVSVLIGFFITVMLRDHQQKAAITSMLKEYSQTITDSLRGLDALRVFDGEGALRYLAGALNTAGSVWNTRVAAPGHGQYPHGAEKAYPKALRDAVRRGVYVQEVVGDLFEEPAADLARESSDRNLNYRAVKWGEPNSPFLNFIVIDHQDGFREAVFGWVITPAHGFNQKVYKSTNPDLIDFFVSLHGYMMQQGAPIAGT